MKKIILVILIFFPLNVYAGEYTSVMGIGSTECSMYNSLTKNPFDRTYKDLYYTWLLGFFSGMNAISRHIQKTDVDLDSPVLDHIAQQGLLDSLCQRYPNERVMQQGLKIYDKMIKLGLTQQH